MDFTGIGALLLAVGTLIWLGYDRINQAKNSGGQYVDSLAATAEKLVNVAQDIYTPQIDALRIEIEALRGRVAELESQLNEYRSCPMADCPFRKGR